MIKGEEEISAFSVLLIFFWPVADTDWPYGGVETRKSG